MAVFLAAADPVSVLPGSLGRGSWCNEHDTIHKRLDIIEEVRATALAPGPYQTLPHPFDQRKERRMMFLHAVPS